MNDVDVEGVLSYIGDLGIYSACINAVVTPWSEGGQKVRGLESVGLVGMEVVTTVFQGVVGVVWFRD